MPLEFRLPELGENIDSGDLVKILVAVGDVVEKDQPVLELETDKATIEVPAPSRGRVTQLHVREGEKIKVGQLILTLEDGVAAPAAAPEAERERPAAPAAQPPPAKQTAPAAAKPSPPTTTAPEAPREARAMPEKTVEFRRPAPGPAPVPAREPAAAAPSVRRLARELGLNINEVPGTGPGGRVSMQDVKNYARSVVRDATGRPAPPAAPALPRQGALPDFSRWGPVERMPMSNVRRKTAEQVAVAWTSVPHVTHHDRADITVLEEMRQQLGPKAEQAGGKLTVTAIALKVAALALKEFPRVCASVDVARGEIVLKKYIHIGVAVDTERGLLVPVIRDVDRKSLFELAAELAQVAAKARNRKLGPDDMAGGCFTVTNLGGIGGTAFSPIVNAPEAAILGLARSRWEPVYSNGQFVPRLVLPLSLSYDHRLIDGADAARFLRRVAELFEKPYLLFV